MMIDGFRLTSNNTVDEILACDENLTDQSPHLSLSLSLSLLSLSLSLSLSLALSLSWQFPLGRRASCDIYWHGVSFHDNDHIVSGQVNKFPGQFLCETAMMTWLHICFGFIPLA